MRGVIQRVVQRILARSLSPEAWETFLATLSPAAQAQFRLEPDDYEWVPMAGLIEGALRHPGGREAIMDLLRGSLYANLMMTEKHRWMLKVMTPELMAEQAPRIFAFYHRGGRMETERVEPGRAAITLRATGPSPAWFGILMTDWLKRSLELSGAEAVESVYEPPEVTGKANLHRYWLSWA